MTNKFTRNITTFDALADQFIIHCIARNLTEASIEAYRVKIRPFKAFCSENELQLTDMCQEAVEAFVVRQKGISKASDITINSYLRSVRAVLYYGMKLGCVPEFKVELLKTEKAAKRVYSDEDLKKLINTDSFSSLTELKIWAFESFLIATGVRLSSATNIKLSDIDFDRKFCLLTHVKNRKQQYIPLSDKVISSLKRYLDIRGWNFSEYLFCNTTGGKMDKRTIEQQVEAYNKKRGVNISSIHAFRHSYAKLSVLNGVDVFRLQKLMGHSSLLVTKEYVDLWGEELRDEWNPLDGI